MRALLLLTFLAAVAVSSSQEMSARQIMLGQRTIFALGPDNRAELKLTKEQIQKITDSYQGTVHVEEHQISLMIDGDADLDAMDQAAMKVLDEGQRKRLNEIYIQELGGVVLADAQISKDLNLSDEQKKSLNALLEAAATDLMNLYMPGHDDTAHKEAEALRKSAGKKMEAVLTKEQMKAFEKMKGEPFKKKHKDGDGGGLDIQ
jgi:hypothetical protein